MKTVLAFFLSAVVAFGLDAPLPLVAFGASVKQVTGKHGAPTKREDAFKESWLTWKKDDVELKVKFEKNVATFLIWNVKKPLRKDEIADILTEAKAGEWTWDDTLEIFRNGELVAEPNERSLSVKTYADFKAAIEAWDKLNKLKPRR